MTRFLLITGVSGVNKLTDITNEARIESLEIRMALMEKQLLALGAQQGGGPVYVQPSYGTTGSCHRCCCVPCQCPRVTYGGGCGGSGSMGNVQ